MLSDFQFCFSPASYCHPAYLADFPAREPVAHLPEKWRLPQQNRWLFRHFALPAELPPLTGLQRVMLLSDDTLLRFLTFTGACFYLADVLCRWPFPARRQAFPALTPADAALLSQWNGTLLRPLQSWQQTLPQTDDGADEQADLIAATGRYVWFQLIRADGDAFCQRARLRFAPEATTPLSLSLTTAAHPLLQTLCQTILSAVAPAERSSAD